MEKIISGLEHCLGDFACVTCPYYKNGEQRECKEILLEETIKVIKEKQ